MNHHTSLYRNQRSCVNLRYDMRRIFDMEMDMENFRERSFEEAEKVYSLKISKLRFFWFIDNDKR